MQELIAALRSSPRLAQKSELEVLWQFFPRVCRIGDEQVLLGDDAAAVNSADGFLLFAAEGVYPPLLEADPYLAGRASVLANVNDIYAMGGRPLAILDVMLAQGMREATEMLRGVNDNALRYNVPVIGGHFGVGTQADSLAVFIIGRARRLLSSFNAAPGDDLVVVWNPRGTFHAQFGFWDSSSTLTGPQAITQLELLPRLAEEGLADSAKDVSMAGIIGTVLMLLEASARGARISPENISTPPGVQLADWLLSFLSYGFVLSLRPNLTTAAHGRFRDMGILCERIGNVTADHQVIFIDSAGNKHLFWDLNARPFSGLARERIAGSVASGRGGAEIG
jgi:AIR synthase-related protein